MNIEQKAREACEAAARLLCAQEGGYFTDWKPIAGIIELQLESHGVFAALQSAVAEEREECAKHRPMLSIDRTVIWCTCSWKMKEPFDRDKWAAHIIAARGQKETVCNCPQLNGPDANQHDMECPAYRRPHKETA